VLAPRRRSGADRHAPPGGRINSIVTGFIVLSVRSRPTLKTANVIHVL